QSLLQVHPRLVPDDTLRPLQARQGVAYVAVAPGLACVVHPPTTYVPDQLEQLEERGALAAADIDHRTARKLGRRARGEHVRFHHVGHVCEIPRLRAVAE